MQLQEKTRILEYAANGCILFTEVMPQKFYSTLNKDFKLPIIEVPREVNKSDFCFDYINKKNIDIQELSRETYESAMKAYNPESIKNVFLNVLNDIETGSAKYSNIKLSKIEDDIIKFKYSNFYLYQKTKIIFKSKQKTKAKIFKITNLLMKEFNNIGFIKTNIIIMKMIIDQFLKKINNYFFQNRN